MLLLLPLPAVLSNTSLPHRSGASSFSATCSAAFCRFSWISQLVLLSIASALVGIVSETYLFKGLPERYVVCCIDLLDLSTLLTKQFDAICGGSSVADMICHLVPSFYRKMVQPNLLRLPVVASWQMRCSLLKILSFCAGFQEWHS